MNEHESRGSVRDELLDEMNIEIEEAQSTRGDSIPLIPKTFFAIAILFALNENLNTGKPSLDFFLTLVIFSGLIFWAFKDYFKPNQ